MRSSIRTQILVPFCLLLSAAIAVTAAVSATAAARRSDEERAAHLLSMVRTLGDAAFPHTASVLEKMKGLTGADFVVFDDEQRVQVATLAFDAAALGTARTVPAADSVTRLTDFPLIEVGRVRYFVSSVPRAPGSRAVTLLLLYPERQWQQARWDAVWPSLRVGASAAAVGVAVSFWIAHRFARRILAVREQLAQLAARQYVQLSLAPPFDELHELQDTANQLSARLASLQDEIVHTERLRLLAQLAGGLAHQLRNAVTGARLAVQLHQRRCPQARSGASPDDESLDIALRQLSLTEEQVKGLLSLGARRPQDQRRGDLRRIATEVGKLVLPMCRHAHVTLDVAVTLSDEDACVPDEDLLRAALVNLCLNAIEAAGCDGTVRLQAARCDGDVVLRVIDSGAGPPDSVRDALFEPFVTSKPEGVGLGLMLVQRAAESCGGVLGWTREADHTVFYLRWPCGTPPCVPITEKQ